MKKEDENLISTLYEQVDRLKSQNASLASKNKHLTEALDKKKREVTIMKKTSYMHKKAPIGGRKENPQDQEIEVVPGPNPHHTVSRMSPRMSQADPIQDANLLEVAKKYKARYHPLYPSTFMTLLFSLF